MQIASEIRDSMRGGRAHIYVVGKSLSWTLGQSSTPERQRKWKLMNNCTQGWIVQWLFTIFLTVLLVMSGCFSTYQSFNWFVMGEFLSKSGYNHSLGFVFILFLTYYLDECQRQSIGSFNVSPCLRFSSPSSNFVAIKAYTPKFLIHSMCT